MADTKIKVDLDPKSVIKSLNDIGNESKKLAGTIEDTLGKGAVKSTDNFVKKSETASSQIGTIYRNLANRIKEDLGAAFDFGKVLAGLKLGDQIKNGVGQVLDMEKAFARLNTRLQMSGSEFAKFKTSMGKAVSSTGQRLEDILPGVEVAASRGGIKDPKALTAIGAVLAKSKALTGENTDSIAEEAVEILKGQGEKITANSMKGVIDAMNASRASGAFKTAAEAGSAMGDVSKYGKKLGMDSRGLAGLTSVASNAGESGQSILQQIMKAGTDQGGAGAERLNSVFGQNIFKNGKLDASAIGKIDTKRFGDQSIMESASGITGANGQELTLFVEAFKKGMPQFQKVVSGADETASQFELASDNLGTSLDTFREGIINSVRDIGGALSTLTNDVLKGKTEKFKENVQTFGAKLADNWKELAAGGAIGLGALVLGGSGFKGLLKKSGGLAEGKALEAAAGVTPVFVVNADQIGGGGKDGAMELVDKALKKAPSLLSSAATLAPKLLKGAGVAGAFYTALRSEGAGEGEEDEVKKMYAEAKARKAAEGTSPDASSPDALKQAVADGIMKGYKEAKKAQPVNLTNPSAVTGRGSTMR